MIPPELHGLLEQAQRMMQQLQQAQQKLEQTRFSASAGGGMVTAEVDGAGRVHRVEIEQQLFEERDRQLVQDLVVAAVNAAMEKAREQKRSMLGPFGQMMPPGFEALFGLQG
ncbi:MAG: YbaB/EbfC family nucleoid-associated protein [Deltaproteobacteria bacterium]|nr:MAG: YbaB/EbfC family nucleoid-associated protein [Deltaproteobacteria bacterium]